MSVLQIVAILAVGVLSVLILAKTPDQHPKRIVRPSLDARPKREESNA